MRNNKGATLVELMVVISVGIVIVAALTFATIASLRNANYAKNQAQATKLSQEGMEKMRTLRNRDGIFNPSWTLDVPDGLDGDNTVGKWNDDDFWDEEPLGCGNKCTYHFFKFPSNTNLELVYLTSSKDFPTSQAESINNGQFLRVVGILDHQSTYTTEKEVTVFVRWTDYAGIHDSKVTTILRRI